MAHFLCHLGAHILEPFCSISILPKTKGILNIEMRPNEKGGFPPRRILNTERQFQIAQKDRVYFVAVYK